jgi:hypothetical protein
MKRFNDSKIMLLLVALVVALMLTAGSAKADFTFGTPTNLGPVVNSSAADQTLNISADGLSLYFSSDRPGGYGSLDLYVATRESTDDDWGPVVNLGPTVNTPSLEGHGCISADGLTLYFCSNRPGGFGSYDLWVTTRATKADKWGTPVNLGPNVNSSTYAMESSISPDGLTLWFESGRPGGLGGGDVWMTTRPTISDPWGPPVNLGPPVNSAFDDGDPSISDDGRILFFTSGRPGGYGNYDLWVSKRKTTDDQWGTTVNLGRSVNQTSNDLGANISADGRTLYFNSNRPGGYGSYDIWQAPIIPVVDFNGDEKVDLKDFSKLAQYWGQNESSVDIAPPIGDGTVDFQDLAVFAEYWLKELGQAWGPTPADGATNQPKSMLSWLAGETAVAHDVYFGTDQTAVTDATWESDEYIDQVAEVVETPVDIRPYTIKALTLQQPATAYYWRIDELEDGTTIKGDVWRFTTAPLKAHSPNPANGEILVDPNTLLNWGAGFNAKTTGGHRVFFGTDYNVVLNATTSTIEYKGTQNGTTYDPSPGGTLALNTMYYWRIDEVNKDNTVTKGDVWMFKTIFNITITNPNLIGWWKLDEGQGTMR